MSVPPAADGGDGTYRGFDVFIRNLLPDTTPRAVMKYFSSAGKIIRAPRLKAERGFAWVTYESMEAVNKAVALSGSYFGSRIVYVHAANNVAPQDEAYLDLHMPALCEETVDLLVRPDPGGIYVDGTFGRGGHTKAMLAAMSPSGRMHAFDMDPVAIKAGKQLMAEDSRFTIHHAPFSSMKRVLKSVGVKPGSVAGVLLDVGISSPQFNDTTRGFRPEADGPLDLRFDTSKGVAASEFLKTVPHSELVRIINEYGEESDRGRASQRIADAICLARSRGELPTRTKAFAELVARAKGKETSGQAMHPAKMTFQALRIHLNDEFGEMRKGMKAAFKLVGADGRIGLITWKFSERKIVDEVVSALEAVRDGEPLLEWYQQQPGAEPVQSEWALVSDDVVRPSEREIQRNSRSRPGLLHILRKRRLPRLARLEKRAYKLPAWKSVVGGGDQAPSPRSRKRRRGSSP